MMPPHFDTKISQQIESSNRKPLNAINQNAGSDANVIPLVTSLLAWFFLSYFVLVTLIVCLYHGSPTFILT